MVGLHHGVCVGLTKAFKWFDVIVLVVGKFQNLMLVHLNASYVLAKMVILEPCLHSVLGTTVLDHNVNLQVGFWTTVFKPYACEL